MTAFGWAVATIDNQCGASGLTIRTGKSRVAALSDSEIFRVLAINFYPIYSCLRTS